MHVMEGEGMGVPYDGRVKGWCACGDGRVRDGCAI